MLLRRRCGLLEALTCFLATASALIFLLVCTIIYGTRTQHPHLPTVVQEVLPAGRCLCQYSANFECDTCLNCASAPPISFNATGDSDNWTFSYRRDAANYGLREDQCNAAFPGLFEDVERARKFRQDNMVHITEEELSSFELTKGMVRAMIFDGELRILQTFLVDNVNREKAISALAALHRAIVSAPDHGSIPSIEFVFSVEDLPAQTEKPLWVLARRAKDDNLWLIPDFGFWSWDVEQLGTFGEVAIEAIQREAIEPWDQKQEKLVWRGKLDFAPKLRHALLEVADGKPWSDVGQVRYGDPDGKFVGPVDQCNYMFIAHAEGRSYSGSQKYRQLCRSVVVSHKLQWIQHHHYLMKSNGPNQNFVEVERDFSNLEAAMNDLLEHPEKAKRIADNSVLVFRERYLTGAAEACYWRALFMAYKQVSFDPVLYNGVGAGEKHKRSQKRGIRWETFMLYEPIRQLDFPESAKIAKKNDLTSKE